MLKKLTVLLAIVLVFVFTGRQLADAQGTRPGFFNGIATVFNLWWATDLDSAMYLPGTRPTDADSSWNLTYGAGGQLIWAKASASGDTIIAGTDTVFIGQLITDSLSRIDSTMQADLEDSLLFQLDLWGSSETVARDISGNDNDGVLTGFSHDATDGFVRDGSRRALLFDGDGDAVLAKVIIDSTSDWTQQIELVMTDTTADRYFIAGYASDSSGQSGKWSTLLFFKSTTDRIQAFAYDPIYGTNATVYGGTGTFDHLAWNQLSFIRSGASLLLYVNGDSVYSTPLAGEVAPIDTVVIGKRISTAATSPLVGSLARVKFYNRALTANEVSALYHQFRQENQPGHPVGVDEDRDVTIHNMLNVDSLKIDGYQALYYDTSISDSTVDLKEGFSPSAWTKAGEALTFGEVVYYATDSTWKLADADTLTGAGSFYSRRGMGMVTADISNGSSGTIMTRGTARCAGWSWTKIGAYLYVSTTAGGLTEAPADTSAGKAVQIVGWVLNPKMIVFDVNFPYASK